MALKEGLNIGGERKQRERKPWVPIEEGLYPLQILDINGVKDFNKKKNAYEDKVQFLLVVCDPDSPMFGKTCKASFTPKVTPAGNDRKESNLHKFLSHAFHKKKGVPEAFRKAFLATLGLNLNELIGKQFVGFLTVETSAAGNEYNKLGTVTGSTKAYPVYVKPAPVLDPRTADDDTSLVCCAGHPGFPGYGKMEPCTNVVHGWKKSEADENGNDWMSQATWVGMQRAKFGSGEDDTDAPIFCGRDYQQFKDADLSAGDSEEGLPF